MEREGVKLPGSERLDTGVHWTDMRDRAWSGWKYISVVGRLTVLKFGDVRL